MALDERDQNFEKALAQRLRRSSGSSEGVCPDAEILAAYHERMLSGDELISWKTHIAGCAKCQELLAQLEFTDAVPVNDEEGVEVFGAMHQQFAASATSQNPMPAAARSAVQYATPAKSPNVREFTPARKSSWRWIVPAGALAAGLLVWVVARENSSLRKQAQPSTEIVANNEPSAYTATPQAAPPARNEASEDALSPATKTTPSPPKRKAKDDSHHSNTTLDMPLGDRNAEPMLSPRKNGAVVSGAATAYQSNAALASNGAAGAVSNAESKPSEALRKMESQPGRAEMASAPPPPALSAKPQPASPHPQTPGATGQAVQNQLALAAEARLFADAKNLKKVSTTGGRDSRFAAAPGGKILWYVGLSGLIEKSSDAGKTFSSQESGVKTELLAASAPNDSVCWVVGRSGTILLTVDGGAHWSKLVSPIQENIGGVSAVDSLHATIAPVANGTGFVTSDGGVTWTMVTTE